MDPEDCMNLEGINIRVSLGKDDLEEIAGLHGLLYSDEFGYDNGFVEYVRETLEEFRGERTDRERIWIVEKDHRVVGSLAVLERPGNKAQLRWFILHPELRGRGIGNLLFKKALDFIKKAGYSSAYLTTQSILEAAASVYTRFGFRIAEEWEEDCWGRKLIQQRYERSFSGGDKKSS